MTYESAVPLVAGALFILWALSLWLLLVGRRPAAILSRQPFPLVGGTVLLFVLSFASLLFLRLLAD